MKTIHPVDEVLPARKLVPLGLQHVLVMYAGAVAVPLIIGRALELDAAQIAFLINADLFACGLATLFQATGFLGLGIRMPVMMGVTFASVGPMLAMIAAGKVSGLSKEDTLNLIYGSVIAAGDCGTLDHAPSSRRWMETLDHVATALRDAFRRYFRTFTMGRRSGLRGGAGR